MDGPASPVKMDAIGRRSLSERAYESLKAAIVNSPLPSEAKPTETAIAQTMGVSPTPVREAFRRLVAADTAYRSRISTDAVNGKLQTVLGLFRDMILRDRTLTASNVTRRREILAEHAGIVGALGSRDADRTEQMSRLHVRKPTGFRRSRRTRGQTASDRRTGREGDHRAGRRRWAGKHASPQLGLEE